MPNYRFLREASADLNEFAGADVVCPEEGRDFDYFRAIVSKDFEALGDKRETEAQASTYNRLDELYAAHVCTWNAQRGHTITSSKHLAIAKELNVHAVFDFGCGCGSDLLTFALEEDIRYCGGTDISKYQAAFVAWRFRKHQAELNGKLLFMSSVPEPRGLWEMIYSIYVLEHLPNPEVAMQWMTEHGQILSLTTQFGKTADHPEHNDYDTGRMDAFFAERGFHRFFHTSRPLMPRMYVKAGSRFVDVINNAEHWRMG